MVHILNPLKYTINSFCKCPVLPPNQNCTCLCLLGEQRLVAISIIEEGAEVNIRSFPLKLLIEHRNTPSPRPAYLEVVENKGSGVRFSFVCY